jgi:A/G-specific adenine glycosylase
VAFNTNKVSALPVKTKTIQKKERWFYFTIACYKNQLLVKRRTEKDIWRGLYAFHLTELSAEVKPEKLAHQVIKQVFHYPKTTLIKISESYTQQLTHQTVHVNFIQLQLTKKIIIEDGYEWITLDKIKDLGFPRVIADYINGSFFTD